MTDFVPLLKQKILEKFADSYCEVSDMTGEGNHIELLLVSSRFENLSRIARQQLVMSEIKELWEQGLHALTMKTWTHQEWKEKSK
jgi:acid stress-induced BolA-like protein IbaG/YrbA